MSSFKTIQLISTSDFQTHDRYKGQVVRGSGWWVGEGRLIFQKTACEEIRKERSGINIMRNQEDKPASFIGKLYNILRSKEYAKIIYWDSEQKGIRILNQKKLEETILPKYFRHNRFSSFVRQLNMYDFHKVHLGDHRSIFLHKTFDPKKKENIHLIRRKVTFEGKVQSEKEEETPYCPQAKENTDCLHFTKSSTRQVVFKNSLKNMISEHLTNANELTHEQAIDQMLAILIPVKANKSTLESKLAELKRERRYRGFLKQSKFRTELYARLGIQSDNQGESLGVLSIQDELIYHTRKSLGPKSLKLLESGPLNFRRDTIGNFLNI